jgi:nitroimidazol reductase NimA-like FMN-containing flavoprotein (pyridoxamine 5'-phosphate oxidase superfamily)
MDIVITGPWKRREIDTYLSTTKVPLRLACVGKDEYPRVVSVWFMYSEGGFLCASHRDSQLVNLLRNSPRVGFEIAPNEPPYYGVRGQGMAEISGDGGAETLRQLIDHYLGTSNAELAQWLMSRGEDEVLIKISAQRFFSWDYRKRMEIVA